MDGFGFIDNDTMTYESAWAGHNSGTATMSPGVVSSADPNYWMVGGPPESGGLEPVPPITPLEERVYSAGHRVDHLDLDANGFVKDGTFDSGFSGQEYVNKKLETKGFKAPCCGGCAGGGECEGGCRGGCGSPSDGANMPTPPDKTTTTSTETDDWDLEHRQLPWVPNYQLPVDEGRCCCCVEGMCVARLFNPAPETGISLFSWWIRLTVQLQIDTYYSMKGVGPVYPCSDQYLEGTKTGERPLKFLRWDPGEWNDANLWNLDGVAGKKAFKEDQQYWCDFLNKGPKSKKGKSIQESPTQKEQIFDTPGTGSHYTKASEDVWIFRKVCSCKEGPYVPDAEVQPECKYECCCALIKASVEIDVNAGKYERKVTIWGPVCGPRVRCQAPNFKKLRDGNAGELAAVGGRMGPPGAMGLGNVKCFPPGLNK
jgi:hypothetical protein